MAALDDFFAKKGKKKKKTKATIQSLEETETTASKPEIEQPQPIVVSSSNEDSEWRESMGSNVEINPEDIRGVNLLTDEEPSDAMQEKAITENESQDDQKIISKGSVASPWQPVVTPPPEQQPKSTTTVTSLAGAKEPVGTYIPPGLRNKRKDPKAPPDINNSQAFPSLMVAMKGESEEEEVKPPPVMKDYTELTLQNKFSALSTTSD